MSKCESKRLQVKPSCAWVTARHRREAEGPMYVVNLEGMQSSLAVMYVYGVGKVCGTPCRRGLVSVVFHSSGREACFVQPYFLQAGCQR